VSGRRKRGKNLTFGVGFRQIESTKGTSVWKKIKYHTKKTKKGKSIRVRVGGEWVFEQKREQKVIIGRLNEGGLEKQAEECGKNRKKK